MALEGFEFIDDGSYQVPDVDVAWSEATALAIADGRAEPPRAAQFDVTAEGSMELQDWMQSVSSITAFPEAFRGALNPVEHEVKADAIPEWIRGDAAGMAFPSGFFGELRQSAETRHDSTNQDCCGSCEMGWGCAGERGEGHQWEYVSLRETPDEKFERLFGGPPECWVVTLLPESHSGARPRKLCGEVSESIRYAGDCEIDGKCETRSYLVDNPLNLNFSREVKRACLGMPDHWIYDCRCVSYWRLRAVGEPAPLLFGGEDRGEATRANERRNQERRVVPQHVVQVDPSKPCKCLCFERGSNNDPSVRLGRTRRGIGTLRTVREDNLPDGAQEDPNWDSHSDPDTIPVEWLEELREPGGVLVVGSTSEGPPAGTVNN